MLTTPWISRLAALLLLAVVAAAAYQLVVGPVVNAACAMAFDGGKDFYPYVGNNPMNWIDPTGLSKRDVQTIMNTFHDVVDRMTQNGERSSPWINNVQASAEMLVLKKKRHLGCGEQAARVYPALDNNHYDDRWHFEWHQRYFPFPHQWLIGVSDNPNDPDVVIDPYNNDVRSVPKQR